MNIFHKITLQSMKKNRTQTIVTIVGVILSAAMITAVTTFGTSLQQFLIRGSIAKYGNWHVEFFDVNSSFLQERTTDSEVTNVTAFENIGYALLNGGQSPEKPYLFLAGFEDNTFDTLPIHLITGKMPENEREILVPNHVAIKGGVSYKVGDTLTLSVGDRIKGDQILGQHIPFQSGKKSGEEKEDFVPRTEKSYTVVGLYERPGFEEHSAPGYTLITKEDSTKQGDSFSLFVTLKNPHNVATYADSIKGVSSYAFNDYLLRFMGISDNTLFNTFVYSVGGIIITIIIIGSIFLIYNSFHISLGERTRQFGILSSVGATPRQLRNSVLFEGLCIGVIGIPIGILVGIVGIGAVIPIVTRNFTAIVSSNVPLTLAVSPLAILAAFLISMITILISAYLPAHKAANTPIMESIRQTNEIKTESKTLKLSKLSRRMYGLEGTLALKNFKRNKKRYRSIVLSLTLSVVLFVSGNAFGTTLKRLSEQMIMNVDGDILFFTQNMDITKLLPLNDKLKTAADVYESSYQALLSYSCQVTAGDLSKQYQSVYHMSNPEEEVQLPMSIQFIPDDVYVKFIKDQGLSVEEYTGEHGKMVACAKQRIIKEGAVNKVFDLFNDASKTVSITPKTSETPTSKQQQDINLTFVNTYPIDPPPTKDLSQNPTVFMVVAPYSLIEKFDVPNITTALLLSYESKNPSKSGAEMEQMLRDMGITSGYTLYNIATMLEQFRNLTFVVDVFTYVFVVMISLIAIANVFNTISTNVKLRKRELAMLRSIGMSDKDFQKMMNFECAFYGMQTLLFGLPLATLSSWLIYKGLAMAEQMENFHYVFPTVSIAISVIGVLLIVFVTMLYAISKIKKENIIDALRDDMT